MRPHGQAEPFEWLQEGARLRATDIDHEWVLAGDGTDPVAPTKATIRGTAEQLYLLVWRRTDWTDLTVEGNEDAVARALSTPLTP